MSKITTQHLEINRKLLPGKAAAFFEALAAYLENQSDPTGLKIDNLRMQAQSLRQDFERIDSLLAYLEEEGKGSQ
jgi:hypothetical protein